MISRLLIIEQIFDGFIPFDSQSATGVTDQAQIAQMTMDWNLDQLFSDLESYNGGRTNPAPANNPGLKFGEGAPNYMDELDRLLGKHGDRCMNSDDTDTKI